MGAKGLKGGFGCLMDSTYFCGIRKNKSTNIYEKVLSVI